MSFGNIVGQLLQQGLGGQSQTDARIGQSARNLSQGGPGAEQIFGSIQSALRRGVAGGGSGSGQGGSLAGMAEAAKGFLGSNQVGGMSGAQIGGLGALAGALLGGGRGATRGAVGGGAMAVLGTLALTALQNVSAARSSASSAPLAAPAPSPHEVAAVASEEGERLVLRAMITAAKADGQIDEDEMSRILGHLKADEMSEGERQFVLDEIHKPLDVADLAREVRTPAQAAEVYAASLLAIDIDSDSEREYLRSLSSALRLEPGVVAFLHHTTGAPTV